MRRPLVHHVQMLRFLAATAVALTHIADRLIPHDRANAWFWAVPWTGGVDLFFVISGFIMAYLSDGAFGSPRAAGAFLKARLIRIVPPYWFFTALAIAAVILFGGRIGGTTLDGAQLVTSFAFIPYPRADGRMNPILSQGWTLNYEMFFYFAFAAALLLKRGLPLLCAAFVALALAHSWIPDSLFALQFWTRPIILEFVTGIALARLYLHGFRFTRPAALLCTVTAILIFFATARLALGDFTHVMHLGLPAVLLCAAAILRPAPPLPGPIALWMQRGGDASYALYLSHYLIINAVVLVWHRLGIRLPWLGVAFGVTVSIVFAMLFFAMVERPVTDLLRNRTGLRRAGPLQAAAP